MKSNEQFKNSIYKKKELYIEKKRAKRKMLLIITTPIVACFILCCAIFALPFMKMLQDTQTNIDYNTPDKRYPKSVNPDTPSPVITTPKTASPTPIITARPSPIIGIELFYFNGSGFSAIFNTSDGGYITTGYSGTLVKFDKDGNKQWVKYLNNYDFRNVIQTRDRGYVAVGSSSLSDGDIPAIKGKCDAIIYKFDKDGNKLWVTSYGSSYEENFYSVIQTKDGDLLVIGGAGLIRVMVKYDINGNKIWDMIYDNKGNDRFNSVAQTNDGGYVAIGSLNDTYAFIMKVDSNGNKIWYKDYKDKTYSNFSSVIQTSGGGICVSGTVSGNSSPLSSDIRFGHHQAIIIMFDNDGNVLWEKNNYNNSKIINMSNVQDLDSMAMFGPIIETNDKSLVILSASFISEGSGNYKNTIYKIDNAGNVLWRKEFALDANIARGINRVSSIIQLNDGSYVVCGSVEHNAGHMEGLDAVLYYFDSNGNLKQ